MSSTTLAALCEKHPYLAADTGAAGEGAASRRPVLPNLVDGRLLVGHQGHALCIADWAHLVKLGGVVNLAAEKARHVAASDASPRPPWCHS